MRSPPSYDRGSRSSMRIGEISAGPLNNDGYDNYSFDLANPAATIASDTVTRAAPIDAIKRGKKPRSTVCNKTPTGNRADPIKRASANVIRSSSPNETL